jgi:hypothetical protein
MPVQVGGHEHEHGHLLQLHRQFFCFKFKYVCPLACLGGITAIHNFFLNGLVGLAHGGTNFGPEEDLEGHRIIALTNI